MTREPLHYVRAPKWWPAPGVYLHGLELVAILRAAAKERGPDEAEALNDQADALAETIEALE